MEPGYTILGGDGKQYGPISSEEFRAWAQQGRVNGDTQVFRSGAQAWATASSMPELGIASTVVAAAPEVLPAANVMVADAALLQQVKQGASWFYWIGALSLVNSIAAISGSDWRFFIGLGVTQFIDEVLASMGGAAKTGALVLDFIAAGLLILFGVMGGKGHAWAMLLGGILLALDGVLVAIAAAAGGGGGLWISFAFHAWAVFSIWRGFLAARALNA